MRPVPAHHPPRRHPLLPQSGRFLEGQHTTESRAENSLASGYLRDRLAHLVRILH